MGPLVGQPAPDFELRDQHGQTRRLSQLRGERNVVVVFYPYAFSGVCTGELRAIRDQLPVLASSRVALWAVSCDPVYALRVFAEREELTYPLLSDFWPHGAVAQAYGVFDSERGSAERATFVVDREGVLRWEVHNAMPDARSIDDYVRVLAELAA
jgi:peroxiredoxin